MPRKQPFKDVPLLPVPQNLWAFDFPALAPDPALVLCDPERVGLFILNPTARYIWLSFQDDSVSQEQLAQRYASRFGTSLAQASTDIETALDSWSETLLSPQPLAVAKDKPVQPPNGPPCFVVDCETGSLRFRITVYDREFAEEIAPRLAHLAVSGDNPDVSLFAFRHEGELALLSGTTCVGLDPEAAVVRILLFEEMTRLCWPQMEWLTVLHAAVCGNASGCVILPAETFCGKTTLAAALSQSGFSLYSDDSAVIDSISGRVVSQPFALMLRSGSWPVLKPYLPNLDSLPVFDRNGDRVRFLPPPDVTLRSTAPRCLLFANYDERAATAAPRRLTPFESLLGLQKSGFWTPHNRETIAAFLSWLENMPAYELSYSSLDEAVPLVTSLLDRHHTAAS